jgi:hypothetical protein
VAEVYRKTEISAATHYLWKRQYSGVDVSGSGELRQVDFQFDDKEVRGLEQNPDTKSRWAARAREGKKVMQFLVEGRYVANVTDGKVNFYSRCKS